MKITIKLTDYKKCFGVSTKHMRFIHISNKSTFIIQRIKENQNPKYISHQSKIYFISNNQHQVSKRKRIYFTYLPNVLVYFSFKYILFA